MGSRDSLSAMGISRDSFHKRRKTGGKLTPWRMKRKFELGRQPAETKIGHKRVRTVRARVGNLKYRALRLDAGNFSWASESVTRKCRLLNVVYNSTNNELVRTNTLVKSGIVQIDAHPFKQWYEQHYGVKIGRKGANKGEEEEVKQSSSLQRKIKKRQQTRVLTKEIENQFNTGRLYAKIASRPGQSGRCDGYILEGAELKFYLSKMSKKK